ncbi:MAG: efflux RND transporter periplasmic adaptor subunit, partial [Bacteriovoracaceae bacterium]|nr:efflux RND transporter periplasmic adaptor subunit [Bacteriovoracaceae bacterium]
GEEYILARKSYVSNGSVEYKELVKESEEKLKLWGIKKFQMEKWYKRGEVPRSINIYSPTSGIVRKRNAVKGKYFKEGQSFFDLADLSDVWVEMDVYESDSALVSIDQEVKLTFQALPGKELYGKIDFVDPVINPKTRTLKVRATISNAEGYLKPGMVADGILKVELDREPFVVPRSAIIDTGKRKVIWSKVSKKSFQAKQIVTGFESEGYVEVVKGLMEGEEVVIDGNFLLDAQAQLFGGYEDHPSENTTHKH